MTITDRWVVLRYHNNALSSQGQGRVVNQKVGKNLTPKTHKTHEQVLLSPLTQKGGNMVYNQSLWRVKYI